MVFFSRFDPAQMCSSWGEERGGDHDRGRKAPSATRRPRRKTKGTGARPPPDPPTPTSAVACLLGRSARRVSARSGRSRHVHVHNVFLILHSFARPTCPPPLLLACCFCCFYAPVSCSAATISVGSVSCAWLACSRRIIVDERPNERAAGMQPWRPCLLLDPARRLVQLLASDALSSTARFYKQPTALSFGRAPSCRWIR